MFPQVLYLLPWFVFSFINCNGPKPTSAKVQSPDVRMRENGNPVANHIQSNPPKPVKANPEAAEWVDLAEFAPEIKQDIKYATTDNFTKRQIYDCPKCLLRFEVAQAVKVAHAELQKKGYGLLMKDCYRPGPYQQRLWDAVPDENYVAPPSKGSMHSRGAAVDLTLVDRDGNELDMGTPYDFFGPEAHTAFSNLPEPILMRRKILKQALENQGFNAIKYEWWHYNYRKKEYPLSNYVWPCK